MIHPFTLLLLLPTALQDGQREPLVAPKVPVEVAAPEVSRVSETEALRFENSDFEGRWFWWQTEIAGDPSKKTAWVQWLIEHEHYEVLEWHTVTQNDWMGTGAPLAAANAPQWLRVALHLHHSVDSHTFDNAKSTLEKNPALAVSWLERFPGKLEGRALELFESLQGSDHPRVETSRYLPPYSEEELFGALEPSTPPVPFAGSVATPGVSYEQQTLRSIDALVMTAHREERWMNALLRLTRGENELVRRAALVAYSHFTPSEIPSNSFLELVNASEEAPGIRAAALVAYSYGPDYEVVAQLLSLLPNTEHPAWSVAVTRLGDLGDAFIAGQLHQVDHGRFDAKKLAVIAGARKQADSRVPSNGQIEAAALRRIAWARATAHPLADRWEREGLEALRASVNEAILDRIAVEGTNWEPAAWLAPELEAPMRELVLRYTDLISQ